MATESRGEARHRPFVVVVGNEKGGTGKSTTAVHIAVALTHHGAAVGALDLDVRQASLTRYFENRERFAALEGHDLLTPEHLRVAEPVPTLEAGVAAVSAQLERLSHLDVIVIDTPGNASPLTRAGHETADTLITPVNDSFIDIDVLARIDRERREILAPSIYSQMVWEAHNRRIVEGRDPIDWIVMRNRLSHIDARNKRDLTRLLEALGNRIGFRTAPGFGERVIYRELFLTGRTVHDLEAAEMSPSHLAARLEVEELLQAIGITSRSAP